MTLRERLIKIGAKAVCHGRHTLFQFAEVAMTYEVFGEILRKFWQVEVAIASIE